MNIQLEREFVIHPQSIRRSDKPLKGETMDVDDYPNSGEALCISCKDSQELIVYLLPRKKADPALIEAGVGNIFRQPETLEILVAPLTRHNHEEFLIATHISRITPPENN